MVKVKINELLQEREKSIYWLAEETGLAYPTVFNLVKNKTNSIHFDTLEKVMKAFNIEDFNKLLVKEE